MRNISQTSGDDPSDPNGPDAKLPEVPDLPDLKRRLPKSAIAPVEDQEDKRQLGLAYVLPTALAAPVVLLTVAGYWLDQKYHWSPYATLTGALLGMVSGFINMIRIASRLNR